MGVGSFVIEGIVVAILCYSWFTTPVVPFEIPEPCVTIGVNNTGYGSYDYEITHKEQVDQIVEWLENREMKRRLNIRFLNEGMMDGNTGTFLYFLQEDGTLIRKVRIFDNYIGITKKDSGTTTSYNYYWADGKLDFTDYTAAAQEDRRLTALENYGPQIEAFHNSWQYEDGCFTFTIPQWDAERWTIQIAGHMIGKYGSEEWFQYLGERFKESSWECGETVTFPLDAVLHKSLTCTLWLNGAVFEYDLLPMIDETFIYRG